MLLVEDNPVNQKIAEKKFKNFGCNVTICNNGEEGFLAFKNSTYDIIFMDVSMPVMDGFKATAAIRSYEDNRKHTPIIAMTAHAMKGDQEKCKSLGMDDYITKPVDWNIVYDLLVQYCPSKIDSSEKTKNLSLKQETEQKTRNKTELITYPDISNNTIQLDETQLLNIAEEGSDFLSEFIEEIKADLAKIMVRINNAINNKDSEKIQLEIHTMKGLFGNVGAMEFVNKVQEIENKVEKRLTNNFLSEYKALQKMIDQLCYTFDQLDVQALVADNSLD